VGFTTIFLLVLLILTAAGGGVLNPTANKRSPKKRRPVFKIKAALVILFLASASSCTSINQSLRRDMGREPGPENSGTYTPSFSYRMLEMAVKLSGYKNIYASDAEELISRAQKINNGKTNAPPRRFYRRFTVTETAIQGHPCFFITPGEKVQTGRAVFFLYGGGFMLGIDFFHWNTIERILSELSIPVCVPLYPVYPETNPGVIISFINESFTRFCAAYPEARIIGLGDSSGAYLLLSFCHYLSAANAPRFPDQLICVSPAQVAGIDEAILDEMKAIDKKDAAISIAILETLPGIFNLNGDDLNWFSAPLHGDFSRFPPIAVFSGTHDIFYPLMEPFVRRVRLQGKPIELYAGPGMMHVWPYMPLASESKFALNIILEIIRNAPYSRTF
jgi:acetyl esterase/lipase